MQQFKVGDWVTMKRNNNKLQWTEEDNNFPSRVTEVELWQPKVGELFWGTRELHPDYLYETRTELFQVKKIYVDGTLSLVSPLDRNVYSLWIQPENLQEFMKTAEPFIGELPSFLKETK